MKLFLVFCYLLLYLIIIYESGSARQSNPKFTDDEPTAGVAQALAKRKAELAKKQKESLAFNNGNLLLAMLGSKTTLAQTSTLNGTIMLTNPGESYIVPATIPEYSPYGNYEHGDKVKRQAKNGEYFSGEVFYLNQSRTFIPDNAEGYEKANKGEFTKSVQTALCAGGEVAAEVGYDILKGACSAESWIASKVWKDDSAAQYWNEAKENLNKDEQYAHKFYKENAPYKADFKDYKATIDGTVEILNILWACEGGIALVKGLPALAKGVSALTKGGINFLKSEKVASNVSKVIDDLGEWTKNIFKKKSISEAKTAETANAAIKYTDDIAEDAGKVHNLGNEAKAVEATNVIVKEAEKVPNIGSEVKAVETGNTALKDAEVVAGEAEKINYSRTPESKVPKAKVEEAKNLFSVQKLFNEDTALEINIYKNLNKSEVGKNVINYIKKNGTSVDVIYDYSTIEEMGMQSLKGMQMGNHIYINARNANTIEEIVKTIIHEETHLEYDVFGAQWAEVFCDLKAELHVKGELSIADIRNVIKSVKDRYFDYPWRLK